MKAAIIFTLCLAASFAAGGGTQQELLGHGVVWSVESVRTWESFDGTGPEEKPYAKWKADGAVMASYTRYTPDQRVAEGKFVEILVWFDATGEENARIDLIAGEGSTLEATLSWGEDLNCGIAAFAIPGAGVVKDKMMIDVWDANLNFGLEPGERTWIMLLFDVPADVTEAELRLKNSEPIPVTIPDSPEE